MKNPVAERINGILKTEFGMDKIFSTMKEMKQQACRSITNYNELRPHASCDYYTPNQAHQMCGVLPKRWKTGTKKNRQHCLKASLKSTFELHAREAKKKKYTNPKTIEVKAKT